jgi:molybdate transport system substrate-binding protein
VGGTITLFAAASLTDSFTAMARAFEASNPGNSVKLVFAGTSTLVTQLQQGAYADVLASADTHNMSTAVGAGLVGGAPTVFARNKLEIAVAPGNPKDIKALSDLGRSDLVLVLAQPQVPVGLYSAQVLQMAGVTAHPASLEADVKAVLTKVELGEADVGIVYVTDVAAAKGKVQGVEIRDPDNVIATYPMAVLKQSLDPRLARAFLAYVLSPAGQATLRSYGFISP